MLNLKSILTAMVFAICSNLIAEEPKSQSVSEAYLENEKADRELNQFLIKENKALRDIIAGAVKRKALLVFENGEVTRIEINETAVKRLEGYQKLDSPLDDRIVSLSSELKEAEQKYDNFDKNLIELNNELQQKDKLLDEMTRKLELSEGDREFLLKSRDKLVQDIKELQKQFDEIAVLREKVLKLQGELMASRKLEWIRRGLYGQAREGGGAKLMSLSKRQQSAPVNDDLTVEIKKDGTVKIAPSKELALKKELKAYVEKLIEDFNTADPVKYKSYFHMPHAKVSTTQVEWMDDVNSPLVNFEKLRDTGWVKSTVNEIEVIYATEDKGLVRLNFSRINKDEEVIVTTDAVYTFTKINGKWGISVLFVGAKDLPLN